MRILLIIPETWFLFVLVSNHRKSAWKTSCWLRVFWLWSNSFNALLSLKLITFLTFSLWKQADINLKACSLIWSVNIMAVMGNAIRSNGQLAELMVLYQKTTWSFLLIQKLADSFSCSESYMPAVNFDYDCLILVYLMGMGKSNQIYTELCYSYLGARMLILR